MPIIEDGTNLILASTSKNTKTKVLLGEAGTSAYDELNDRLGIKTASPTHDYSLGGNAARTFGLERHTTAATAGNSLTVNAGAPKAGETNQAGGILTLQGGVGTGTGVGGSVKIQTALHGSTGTTDNALATVLELDENSDALLNPEVDSNIKKGRRTTAAAAGKKLTVAAGSPKSGETNQAGGDLVLAAGPPTGSGAGGSVKLQTAPAGSTGTADGTLATGLELDQKGNLTLGPGAVAASTDGFPYIPTVATAPSGTPTAKTGYAPIVFCTGDAKLYLYTGSAWIKTAALT